MVVFAFPGEKYFSNLLKVNKEKALTVKVKLNPKITLLVKALFLNDFWFVAFSTPCQSLPRR